MERKAAPTEDDLLAAVDFGASSIGAGLWVTEAVAFATADNLWLSTELLVTSFWVGLK